MVSCLFSLHAKLSPEKVFTFVNIYNFKLSMFLSKC